MKGYKISWMMKKDHEIPKITKDEKIMWKGMKNHETYEETLWNILKDDERWWKIAKNHERWKKIKKDDERPRKMMKNHNLLSHYKKY